MQSNTHEVKNTASGARPVAQRFARELSQSEINAVSGSVRGRDTLIIIILEAVDTETIIIIY